MEAAVWNHELTRRGFYQIRSSDAIICRDAVWHLENGSRENRNMRKAQMDMRRFVV